MASSLPSGPINKSEPDFSTMRTSVDSHSHESFESKQCLKFVSIEDELFQNNSKRRCSNEREHFDSCIRPTPAPLPDVDEDVSPDQFLVQLIDALHGFKLEKKPALLMKDFFGDVSEEQMAAYNTEIVAAVRNDDMDQLERLQQDGQAMNCFNRFGESLLNIACRRGFEDIVRYLLDQPNISLRQRDDCGRTPLHDACWHPSPQLTICKWILDREPTLFFVMDRRGCTAFEYARPEHWPVWRKFLLENKESLKCLTNPETRAMLSIKP